MADILLSSVQAALDIHSVAYRTLPCDPAYADTAGFCQQYGFEPGQSANTIIVAGKAEPTVYAACVILANTRLDANKKVRELLGTKKVSFAPMEAALQLSGMEYGGVTIFGLPANIPVYVDKRVMQQHEVILGGGNRSSKVILPPHELTKLPGLTVVENLAKTVG